MTTISSTELSQLRERPHRTRLYLGIYQPTTIYSAQINQAGIAKGEREITVTGISGTITDIIDGMTMYIGTEAGGREIDRIRAKSGSGSTITIAENDLDWQNGWYLTVVSFYEPWAKFPRITLDADNVPSFFKDFDEVYTDEHQRWRPVAVMGGNVAGLRETGSLGVYYSASGSYVEGSDSLSSYLREFEGGLPTGSVNKDPGWIQYGTPGQYTTKLTVTTALGKEWTGYRHVLVYDHPDAGGTPPILKWGFSSMEGSRDDGGYTMNVWLREDADLSAVTDGALIVVFSEDWEGGVKGKVGGNAPNRESILFVGYIQDGSIAKNFVDNRYEFRAVSVTGRMKVLAGYSATLQDKQNSITWNEAQFLTGDKAILAFLQDQSTIMSIADFVPTGDTKPVKYADFERSTIYDTANAFLMNSLLATMVTDRQGRIYTEIEASMTPTGTRAYPDIMELTNRDWRNEIRITETQTEPLAYVELGGIAYSGADSGTNSAFIASAPGDPAGYFGSLIRSSGLILSSQTQLNILCALVYESANARYPRTDIMMAGDYRLIDIAPQQRIDITLVPSDTHRGLSWQSKRFFPREVRYSYNGINQVLTQEVTVKEETGKGTGRSIIIPVDPPYESPALPQWNFPDFPPLPAFPPFPDIPIAQPPALSEAFVYYAVAAGGSLRIVRTTDYWATPVVWEEITHNYTSAVGNFARDLFMHPTNPNIVWGCKEPTPTIFKTNNFLDDPIVWETVLDQSDLDDLVPPFCEGVYEISYHPLDNNLMFITTSQSGGGGSRNYVLRSEDAGANWTRFEAGTDGNNPLGGLPPTIEYTPDGTRMFQRYSAASDDDTVQYSDDFGKVWTTTFTSATANRGGMTELIPIDASRVFGSYDDANGRLVFSVDANATIVDVPYLFGGLFWTHEARSIRPNLMRNMRYHPLNSAIYAMVQEADAGQPETIFMRSFTNGQSWEFVTLLIDDIRQGLKINPGDITKFYAVNLGENNPTGSDNAGLNWPDKRGNLDALLGTSAHTPTSILPVYL